MANHIVTGKQYFELDGRLCEIKRQLRQKDGYPYDPTLLKLALQAIIEGRFPDLKKHQAPDSEEFVTPLSQEEAVTWLVDRRKYTEAQAAELYQNWSSLQHRLEHYGTIAWQVRAGFTLKQHAPQAGPCYQKFEHLQGWNFVDESTKDCLVFWIPTIVHETRDQNKDEQLATLAKLRGTKFPKHHLSGFGTATLLTALILAEFKRSGKHVPESCHWVRTDTHRSNDDFLSLGSFDRGGLDYGGCWAGCHHPILGAFALGMEIEA